MVRKQKKKKNKDIREDCVFIYVKENEVIREKFREARLPLENSITREQQGRIHAPGQWRGIHALPRV